MSPQQLPRWRVVFIALVILAELAHLIWEHLHGGVLSHHLLNRADLPAISNYWGALVLPVLAWFTTAHVQSRLTRNGHSENNAEPKIPASVIAGFLVPLILGGLLAAAFMNGLEDLTGMIFMSLLVLAALLPAYRPESALGFILGMAFTFGAVLPLLVATLLATLSAAIHLCVVPVSLRIWRGIRAKAQQTEVH